MRFGEHLVACLICAQQVLTRWRRLGHQVHIGAAHAEAWLLGYFGVQRVSAQDPSTTTQFSCLLPIAALRNVIVPYPVPPADIVKV